MIDKPKFHAALRKAGEWEGCRCRKARNNDEGDVVAAAIGMSCLVFLRNMAEHKALFAKDIQQFIDGFYADAGVVEKQTAMGGVHYERKLS